MNILKINLTLLFLIPTFSHSQTLSVSGGGGGKYEAVKGNQYESFQTSTHRYFITKNYKTTKMEYHLLAFNENGHTTCDQPLKIVEGEFKNMFTLDGVFTLGNKAYVLVEHMDKTVKMKSQSARLLESSGNIAVEETVLINNNYEKINNSGYNFPTISPDRNLLAAVAEMPYEKEKPALFKVAFFDKDLKKTKEFEISLPGENTKNKLIISKVANDGTLYLLRKTTSRKGEIVLKAYQWSAKNPTEVKEYTIDLPEPDYITSFQHDLTPQNELIVAGVYYQRKTLSVGETQVKGVFMFINKGQTEKIMKATPLEKPIDNLQTRHLIMSSNTAFLCTEQFKEEREAKPPGDMSFDYNYNYTHNSDYVIGFDFEGVKKFEVQLAKEFSARNFDLHYFSGYHLLNDQLTIVYNDLTKKYIDPNYNHNSIIPLVVQVTNDGRSTAPVLLRDQNKLEDGFMLTPSISLSNDKDAIYSLSHNSSNRKLYTIKLLP